MKLAYLGLFLVLCFCSQASEACTLADDLEERADRLILVGEISMEFGVKYDGQMIYGFLVRPLRVFQNPREELPEALQVFPTRGMRADCSVSYFSSSLDHYASLIERYPPGRLVAVSAFYRTRHGPGDENAIGGGIEVLPEDCSVQQVADSRPTYERRQTSCGNSAFHAYKEIAGFPSASIAERKEVLTRLANFEMFMDFASLVRKYIDDAETVEELLELRYAEVIAFGCENRPPQEYEIDASEWEQIAELRFFRSRWYEYCRAP